MKYIVMECKESYCVVLDENGQLIRAANLHYTVGQTVDDIIEMQIPETRDFLHDWIWERRNPMKTRWVRQAVALAACFLLVIGVFLWQNLPCAAVYISINPEVRMDINRRDVVVRVEGINDDGDALLEGYQHRRDTLTHVTDLLIDRAIAQGFLHEGGKIVLSLEANDTWVETHTQPLASHVNEHLADHPAVSVDVKPGRPSAADDDRTETRPVETEELQMPVYSESDYGDAEDHSDITTREDVTRQPESTAITTPPQETIPAVTHPTESTQAKTTEAETAEALTRPAVTTELETQPVVTKEVVTEPTVTTDAMTSPAETTDAVDTRPVETQISELTTAVETHVSSDSHPIDSIYSDSDYGDIFDDDIDDLSDDEDDIDDPSDDEDDSDDLSDDEDDIDDLSDDEDDSDDLSDDEDDIDDLSDDEDDIGDLSDDEDDIDDLSDDEDDIDDLSDDEDDNDDLSDDDDDESESDNEK